MSLHVELIEITIAIGENGLFVLGKSIKTGDVLEGQGYPIRIPPDLILD